MLRTKAQTHARQSITIAARKDMLRFLNHHTLTKGKAMNKAGFSQKASATLPCNKAIIIR